MNIYSVVASNKRKTWLIIVLFVLFIVTVAYVFGKASGYGLSFVGIALILAGLTSFASYYFSDQLVLLTVGAKEIEVKDNPTLFHLVENLCIASGLTMPRIYLMNEVASNAFATGRDPKHAVICLTTGILNKLEKAELEGVIAHELSHVRNYDTRLMGIVAILVGFVAILANIFMQNLWFGNIREDREDRNGNLQLIFLVIGIAFAILSPLVASLIQLSISRKREYLADASGALLTRYPEGLARALEKISQDPTVMPSASNATAHLFITNPFKGKNAGVWFASLFDTHPPIADRIKILRSM